MKGRKKKADYIDEIYSLYYVSYNTKNTKNITILINILIMIDILFHSNCSAFCCF